jgi:hypothetical protein
LFEWLGPLSSKNDLHPHPHCFEVICVRGVNFDETGIHRLNESYEKFSIDSEKKKGGEEVEGCFEFLSLDIDDAILY